MVPDKPIALITGANRGIGFALAQTLARDHHFHVLLGARNQKSGSEAVSKLQSQGLSVDLVELDVSSDSSIAQAAAFVNEKYGYIDVLVNNAGFMLESDGTVELDNMRRTFRETFETNVFGAAAVTEAFVPLLENSAHTPPRVVFLSSTLGSISVRSDPKSKHNFMGAPV